MSIIIKNLNKSFQNYKALDNINLEIPEGNLFALLGPSGSGKTTLLRIIAGLESPDSGEIQIAKNESDSKNSQPTQVGFVFQHYALFRHMNIFENIAFGLRVRPKSFRPTKQAISDKVFELLKLVQLEQLHNRYPHELSGGQRQRVALARALAIEPKFLLLDEPFSALDPIMRETLIEDLEHVLRETGITTIFVTHDRMEALRLATRLGVMHAGEILQTGSPEEVMNHPVNEFVASLVAVENILKGKVIRRNGRTFFASVSGQEIEGIGDVGLGEEVSLCIRPENVTLSPFESGNPTSAINTFPGTVGKITPIGYYRKAQLNCGFPLVAYVTNSSFNDLALNKGTKVLASFDTTAIHVIRESTPTDS